MFCSFPLLQRAVHESNAEKMSLQLLMDEMLAVEHDLELRFSDINHLLEREEEVCQLEADRANVMMNVEKKRMTSFKSLYNNHKLKAYRQMTVDIRKKQKTKRSGELNHVIKILQRMVCL